MCQKLSWRPGNNETGEGWRNENEVQRAAGWAFWPPVPHSSLTYTSSGDPQMRNGSMFHLIKSQKMHILGYQHGEWLPTTTGQHYRTTFPLRGTMFWMKLKARKGRATLDSLAFSSLTGSHVGTPGRLWKAISNEEEKKSHTFTHCM